jgi:hypothetical protein
MLADACRPAFHSAGLAIGLWRSLVARLVRDEEAAGSNPVSPTVVMSQDIGDNGPAIS